MTLLDLGLLVLFGIQHPNCKQRSPRVYISGVDHGASQQKSGKEGNGGSISLQVKPPYAHQAYLGAAACNSSCECMLDGQGVGGKFPTCKFVQPWKGTSS